MRPARAIVAAALLATAAFAPSPSAASGGEGASAAAQSALAARSLWTDGELLRAVQTLPLFNDSKHFVDMPALADPDDIACAWTALNWTRGDRATLAAFVGRWFGEPGSDLVPWTPPDWGPNPSFLTRLSGNASWARFGRAVHGIWPVLGRVPTDAVREHPDRHTLLWTPNRQIVPGGRFREFYYWDSYWIIKGLVVSGMVTTAQGIALNLLSFVDSFGFVPNGGRAYYLTRSQPPLLSDMVREVHDALAASGDTSAARLFLARAAPTLEAEYAWWVSSRAALDPALAPLSSYNANTSLPRPESYLEDVTLAGQTPQRPSANLFRDVAAGAESGWDFSSRWFANGRNLSTIDTTEVVPVDMNAILLGVELNLHAFCAALNNATRADAHLAAARARHAAMQRHLRRPGSGWRDLRLGVQSTGEAAASDFVPLWVLTRPGVASLLNVSVADVAEAAEALARSGLVEVAGVRTTTLDTGQQWDSPNAWAPLQHVLIEALLRVDPASSPSSAALGRRLAVAWLETNMFAYNRTGFMYEKYSAFDVGRGGGGGEYVPQKGFGWTNGVALALLDQGLAPGTGDGGLGSGHDGGGDAVSTRNAFVTAVVAATVTASALIGVGLLVRWGHQRWALGRQRRVLGALWERKVEARREATVGAARRGSDGDDGRDALSNPAFAPVGEVDEHA